MVKEIVHDPLFLGQKSTDATEDDKQVAIDLLDTLRANLEHCVGMAANMIRSKEEHYCYKRRTGAVRYDQSGDS